MECIKTKEILTEFKLPITYIKEKIKLNKNIISNLELVESDNDNYLYSYIFDPSNKYSKLTSKLWSEYYTNNKQFLKDTKYLIKTFKNKVDFIEDNNDEIIDNIYDTIFDCDNFDSKYQYIDVKLIKNLNYNTNILQFITLYNLSSPLISLLTPLVMLLIPFFILKFNSIDVNLNSYLTHLKLVFRKHTFGPILNGEFDKISFEKKIYLIITIIFYIYKNYENIRSCLKFHNNMNDIHYYYDNMKIYLNNSINKLNNFYKYTSKLKTYKLFNNDLITNRDFLLDFYNKLNSIKIYNFNPKKLLELGKILQLFYCIKNDCNYLLSIKYNLYFDGFINNIINIQKNVKNKSMNFSKFSNKSTFKNAYYPVLKDSTPVKNSYSLNKHLIITGPNAAGKTTFLKTTLINIILNQQIGCGFYDDASLKLYKTIQCYINIPDTNGRDSLFQAEARQCKKILDTINKFKNDNHLCVFDELYSGTNPYEAISSSYSYIKYLNNFNNLNFVLTTHYTDLCNKLDSENNINNYSMEIINNNNKFKYTYLLKKGISDIKGGCNILNDLKYPEDIINEVNNVIKDINI